METQTVHTTTHVFLAQYICRILKQQIRLHYSFPQYAVGKQTKIFIVDVEKDFFRRNM